MNVEDKDDGCIFFVDENLGDIAYLYLNVYRKQWQLTVGHGGGTHAISSTEDSPNPPIEYAEALIRLIRPEIK